MHWWIHCSFVSKATKSQKSLHRVSKGPDFRPGVKSFSSGLMQSSQGEGRNIPQAFPMGSTQQRACVCAKRWQTWSSDTTSSQSSATLIHGQDWRAIITKEGESWKRPDTVSNPFTVQMGNARNRSLGSPQQSLGATGWAPGAAPWSEASSCFHVSFSCVFRSYITNCFLLPSLP